MIILDCVGDESSARPSQQRQNMEAYANAGGRIFASHYAYVWLFGAASDCPTHASLSPTANWTPDQS